jgi:hypothetical protein
MNQIIRCIHPVEGPNQTGFFEDVTFDDGDIVRQAAADKIRTPSQTTYVVTASINATN